MKSAFLMHPLDASYVQRSDYIGLKYWAGFLPKNVIEFFTRRMKPFVQKEFRIKDHESMIIICPLTSSQMVRLPKKEVILRLKQACDLAYANGAEIISLGAYSAIASNQGIDLKDKVEIGLTTGRAYTIYTVMQQALPYLKEDSLVAVVGGDGAIGSALVKLAEKYKIIKITKENVDELYSADIIISATSSLGTIIESDKLKKGAVVIDAAKPSDFSRKFKREDIKVIDGGLVKVPDNVDFGINFDLGDNTVYACMAEAFILGMNDVKGNFCIGKDIDLEKVEYIGKLGKEFEVV